MLEDQIAELRHFSRKVVRELGMLQLNQAPSGKTPPHWHALIEIAKDPAITISQLSQLLLLSTSAMSRVVNVLVKQGFVEVKEGMDKREKYLQLTHTGQQELEYINAFSNAKIKGAFEFLSQEDQDQVMSAMQKYAEALEKSRHMREHVKILTLSTARPIRRQIVQMIEHIQKKEFLLAITDDINYGIIKAEEEYYYNNSYNFWYAVDKTGTVIGSIGLKLIDPNKAEIKKFFVSQPYRGKGVAQKLFQTLLKAAHKHQFEMLYLGTVSILKAAHRFYEKCGFIQITQAELPVGFALCPVDTVFFKIHIKDITIS